MKQDGGVGERELEGNRVILQLQLSLALPD